jgi:hypothetical protein
LLFTTDALKKSKDVVVVFSCRLNYIQLIAWCPLDVIMWMLSCLLWILMCWWWPSRNNFDDSYNAFRDVMYDVFLLEIWKIKGLDLVLCMLKRNALDLVLCIPCVLLDIMFSSVLLFDHKFVWISCLMTLWTVNFFLTVSGYLICHGVPAILMVTYCLSSTATCGCYLLASLSLHAV